MASWYDPFGVEDYLFHPDKPYEEAGKELEKYINEAREYQKPFYEAGTSAIPQYQNYLKRMKKPDEYINKLLEGYSTSPAEQYAQDQAMRAATNMGSAYGLSGSTPLQMQAQQNAGNIANQYQEQWLQDVLGINSQYGSGLSNLIHTGQGSGNTITDLISSLGGNMAGLKFGGANARNQQLSQLFGILLRGALA